MLTQRCMWRGSIRFGLMNVGVGLYPAVREQGVRFRQVSPAGNPTREQVVDAVTGDRLERTECLKGFELDDDSWVVLRPAEVEGVAGENPHQVDLGAFVPADSVDPIYWNRAYLVAPDKGSERAYALLAATLRDEARVGLGRIVLRGSREHACMVDVLDGRLVLSTLHYAYEVSRPRDAVVLDGGIVLSERECEAARALVAAYAEPSAAAFLEMVDEYRAKLLALVASREAVAIPVVAGEERRPVAVPKAAPVGDLMAQLEASLSEPKKGRAKR